MPKVSEDVHQRYTFTGREAAGPAAAAAGAPMYYRYRMYSPGLGRFGRRDPRLGGDGLYNAYAYPNNDSIGLADPFGLGRPIGELHSIGARFELAGLSRGVMKNFMPAWLVAEGKMPELLDPPDVSFEGSIRWREWECDDIDPTTRRKRCANVIEAEATNVMWRFEWSVMQYLMKKSKKIQTALRVIKQVQGQDAVDFGLRFEIGVKPLRLQWDGCRSCFHPSSRVTAGIGVVPYGRGGIGRPGTGAHVSADITVGKLVTEATVRQTKFVWAIRGDMDIALKVAWDFSALGPDKKGAPNWWRDRRQVDAGRFGLGVVIPDESLPKDAGEMWRQFKEGIQDDVKELGRIGIELAGELGFEQRGGNRQYPRGDILLGRESKRRIDYTWTTDGKQLEDFVKNGAKDVKLILSGQ